MALLSSSSFFASLGLPALFSIAPTTVINSTECPLAQDSGKEPKNFLTSHSPGRDSCLSHKRTLKRKRKAGEQMVNCIQITVVFAQSLSLVQLFVTPWTAAHQASLSSPISRNLRPYRMVIELSPQIHVKALTPSVTSPNTNPDGTLILDC